MLSADLQPRGVKMTGGHLVTSSFEKLSASILGIVVIFNGVTNYIFGEIPAEGMALGFSLVYLLSKIKLSTTFIAPLIFLVSFMLASVVKMIDSGSEIRLLFLYPYAFCLLIIFLPVYNDRVNVNCDFLAKVLMYFACVSAVYAVMQRLGLQTVLPLENPIRATGLSRSSLNLTGCLFAVLAISVLTVKESYKKSIICTLLFLGLVAAGGRGGMISAIVMLGLFYAKKILNKKSSFLMLIVLVSLLTLVLGEHLLRAFSAFDFWNDQSNLDRLGSYMEFFQNFKLFGAGVGSTSPAAGRFIDATGFESSFLNLIYELGLAFGLFCFAATANWFLKLSEQVRKKMIFLAVSIMPMTIGQQLYGIPSAFVSLALCVYIIISNRKSVVL